ncbi:MAG: FKBP-type peptidyl-prolyl cis-trans isomerase [Bacteroidales bacterium]|nr:FKBP-type peptidyl-prolyl cis-trans isomerase [Bacteroidales bacterium]
MIRQAYVVLTLLLLFPVLGCEEEANYQSFMEEEERYFNLYMDANYPGEDSLESGLYYFSEPGWEGTGASPDSGDFVLVNYIVFTIPNETVVDTYVKEWAIDYNLYNSSILYGPYKYKHGTEIEGLKEGLSMMKEGGIARLLFKSNLGYKDEGSGPIGAYSSLMYDIELIEVIDDPAAKEFNQIKEYLDTHPGYTSIYDEETETKMYYYPVTAGDSTFIKEEETVEIFYTGRLLDGRVFDSNEGASSGLTFTVGDEEVIRGWEVGIKYFRYGGKGKLLIPHPLGYGDEGSMVNNTNKTSIPPFEALLFDIEVSMSITEEKE